MAPPNKNLKRVSSAWSSGASKRKKTARSSDPTFPPPFPPVQSFQFPDRANFLGQTASLPTTTPGVVYSSTAIFNNVAGDQFNVNSNTQEGSHEKIRQWLRAPDSSSNHKTARSKRQPNTGNWFIQGDIFVHWMTSPLQNLWLHGRPGCGKTILSSTIIEAVIGHCNANPASSMAYFYFDFQSREKQTCQSLLRSLITQFCLQITTIPESLALLHSQSESGRYEPDIDDLAMVLKGILQELTDAFIVVDALDECMERERLLKLVEDMIGWRLRNVHMLLTSRKEREIEDSLRSRVSHQMDIQEEVIAQDIELHVQESLRNDTKLNKWPTKVQEEIKCELTKGANGMFRWVACQLDELRKCAKLSELKRTLRSLPKTLDATYERILINIDDLYKDDVRRVLQWLCFSLQPITLDEMVEALAVTFHDGPKFDPDERYADPRDILTRCSSLVSISTTWGTDELRLAHFSVKEYLLSDRIRNGTADIYSVAENQAHELRLAHFSVKEYLLSDRIRNGTAGIYGVTENQAHSLISKTCVAYLLQFNTPDCLNDSNIKQYPLALYAARNWAKHARFEEDVVSDKLLALIMELFQSPEAQQHTWQFVNWVRLHDITNTNLWGGVDLERTPHSIPIPFYYAAFGGMLSVVQGMIEEGVGADVRPIWYGSALQGASSEGQERIVRLLLQHGANANADGGEHGSALQRASSGGHERIVELLLQHGANVNVNEKEYGSALQQASSHGYERVVELLLQHGANVNADGGKYGSALQQASSRGHERVVELLLQHGANVNADGGEYGSALQVASYRGDEQIVQLLLQYGANVNADGGKYGSALQVASCAGNERIVQLLLHHGANVHDTGPFDCVIHRASSRGHHRIVQLLLQHGTRVSSEGDL